MHTCSGYLFGSILPNLKGGSSGSTVQLKHWVIKLKDLNDESPKLNDESPGLENEFPGLNDKSLGLNHKSSITQR